MHKILKISNKQAKTNHLYCCNQILSLEMLQLEDLNNEIKINESWGCAASVTQSSVSLRKYEMLVEGKEASKLHKISVQQRKKMMNVKNCEGKQGNLYFSKAKSPSFKDMAKMAKENNEEDKNRHSLDSDYFNFFQSKSKQQKKSLRLIKHKSNEKMISMTQQHKNRLNTKQTPFFQKKQQTFSSDQQSIAFVKSKKLTQPWSKLDLGRNLPTYQSLYDEGMSPMQNIGKYQ